MVLGINKESLYTVLQPHTVKIYDLKGKECRVETVPARSLLHPLRFDLFAKLFYISNRVQDPFIARKVYIKHIMTFNPDGREPGRKDKDSLEKFIIVFNQLIDHFANEEFDSTQSIVPVGKNGIILDGAHRVAALSYYNKQITIARFDSVEPKCMFDYHYFLARGLPRSICDIIAKVLMESAHQMYVACLWPRMGSIERQEKIMQMISSRYMIVYDRDVKISRSSLVSFIARVYKGQDWVGNAETGFIGARDKAMNVYGKGGNIKFLFFESNSLSDVVALKEEIRELIGCGKHAIHITDTKEETLDIALAVLDENERGNWLCNRDNMIFVVNEWIKDKYMYIRYVWWLKIKIMLKRYLKYILHSTNKESVKS